MTKYKDILSKKMNSSTTESLYLKNVSTSKLTNIIDIQGVLELLNTTNDVNLQIKLFSALSAYLMFNKDTNLSVIIKSSAVYDKIRNVLEKGLPRKATEALNFLSALLYVDAEEDGTTNRKTLAIYARNMTRVSGCLAAMTDMFTNCMMYHDTWKALCQCLAISCSDCEINQSYCTNLIPVCIQKCNQTNIDIFLLLQSLVLNHKRNIQLFLEFNGISIFIRDLLHYDNCLQLLTTVVQCSSASSILLRESKVLDVLRDFLRLYGPDSKIGQKAMIILNHIESYEKTTESYVSQNINKNNITKTIECKNDGGNKQEAKLFDETNILMQNVMKEIFKYKQNDLKQLKRVSKSNINSLVRGTSDIILLSKSGQMHNKNAQNKSKTIIDCPERNRMQCNIATELTFSFLEDQFNNENSRIISFNGTNPSNSGAKSFANLKGPETQTLVNVDKDSTNFCRTISNQNPVPIDLKDFRPIFSSTPKRSKQMSYSKISRRTLNITTQSQMTRQIPTKVQKRISNKIQNNKHSDLRNRSLSSRFFSAINDSCTTLVKTVANIFKKKQSTNTSEDSLRSQLSTSKKSILEHNDGCSFSFLNYMKKRDEILNNNLLKYRNPEYSNFSLEKSCDTCDNTEVLKQKMTKNENLRKTVKKLKLGINLYGCDFKKISRTMWPRESYMTPVVLYNLYRKLLLK